MQTLTQIKAMLEARGLRPRHRFGQNFLHDHNQLRRLLDAARVRPGDVVLEIGPGTGTLTEALLEAGAEVIACEIDGNMADIVEERCLARGGDPVTPSPRHPLTTALDRPLTLVRGDCLDGKHAINPEIIRTIGGRAFKLVANLPYSVATPLIVNLLIDHPNCKGMFVTIQKEVADRLLASPSTKDYGPLSIIVQAFAGVDMIGVVPASCFWPQPEVTSAMVAIVPRRHSTDGPQDRRAFAKFVTTLFTKRRKQLGSIFGRDRTWPKGVSAEMRPEELTPLLVIELRSSLERPIVN